MNLESNRAKKKRKMGIQKIQHKPMCDKCYRQTTCSEDCREKRNPFWLE